MMKTEEADNTPTTPVTPLLIINLNEALADLNGTPAEAITITNTETTKSVTTTAPQGNSTHISGPNSGFFLHFDKKLSDSVKRFPCLFDSKTIGYKDRNITSQCWDLVAKEVKVESGEHAQKLYFNLKKRFHKRRNILKRLSRSGTSNQFALKKAKRDVLLYSFLNWLIPFTQVRQPRTPFVKLQQKIGKEDNDDDQDYLEVDRPSFLSHDLVKPDYNINMQALDHSTTTTVSASETGDNSEPYIMDSDDLEDDIITVTPQSPVSPYNNITTSSCSTSDINPYTVPLISDSSQQSQSTLHHRVPQDTLIVNSADGLRTSTTPLPIVVENLKSVNSTFQFNKLSKIDQVAASLPSKKHLSELNKINSDDEDSLFGLMIAAELKRFPRKERCIAKHQIQNIIFDIQMSVIKNVQKK